MNVRCCCQAYRDMCTKHVPSEVGLCDACRSWPHFERHQRGAIAAGWRAWGGPVRRRRGR